MIALLVWTLWGGTGSLPVPQLVDVTSSAGIEFVHHFGDDHMDNIVESTGAGVIVFDYDGDGWMDVYFINGCYDPKFSHPKGRGGRGKWMNQLYRNRGNGTFENVTLKSGCGDRGYGMSGAAADVDGDGDSDLLVTNYGGSVLYRNLGDGTFSDVTREAGLIHGGWAIGCAFFDADRDGILDLYIGRYLEFDPAYRLYYAADVFPGPLSYPGQKDLLYRGLGDGRFEPMAITGDWIAGRTMGVAPCDLDLDGDMDLFAANDAMENSCLINSGTGKFSDQALLMGVAFGQNGEATSAMGPEFGDYNNDGRFDLLVPDMLYGCLYRNEGKGLFSEQGARSGMASSLGQYVSWSGNFVDLNNDGWLDMFVTNGSAHRMEGEEDLIFLNRQGQMVDVSARCGPDFQNKLISRGSATFDYDGDGDMDLVISNVGARPRLLRNDQATGFNYLLVDLKGQGGLTDAIGARVTLKAGTLTQIREKRLVTGYLSQGDPRLHFGLGRINKIEKIEVIWPSGRRSLLEDVPANQVLVIQEQVP